MDKLIRKKRYLNTTSNKKKVLAFNQDSNIIDLEQIRLLYNENVSLYNRNAEKHSNPIRKKKVNELNKKKREEKLNKINFYILQARLGNQDITKKKIEEPKIHFQLVLKTGKTFKKNWQDRNLKIVTNKKDDVVFKEIVTKTYCDKKSNIRLIASIYDEDYYGYDVSVIDYTINFMYTDTMKIIPDIRHMMKRCFILKTDWLQYSQGISQSAYEEESDNDCCVYRQSENVLLNPKTGIAKKRINGTKVSQQSLFYYFVDIIREHRLNKKYL